jgi:hypothetical protein
MASLWTCCIDLCYKDPRAGLRGFGYLDGDHGHYLLRKTVPNAHNTPLRILHICWNVDGIWMEAVGNGANVWMWMEGGEHCCVSIYSPSKGMSTAFTQKWWFILVGVFERSFYTTYAWDTNGWSSRKVVQHQFIRITNRRGQWKVAQHVHVHGTRADVLMSFIAMQIIWSTLWIEALVVHFSFCAAR